MRTFLLLLLVAIPGHAQDPAHATIVERRETAIEHGLRSPTQRLHLTLALLDGSGWAPQAILAAVRESAGILAQCGVALEKAELVRISAPVRFRDFHTPVSRELAQALSLAKPTVYFVAGTRQQPAFDAEAIGRGNSRSRPELADTVWVTRATRDPGIAIAHELAHVLMDSGDHSEEANNLMRDETSPGNVRLSATQCARIRDSGSETGLLRPSR